MMNWTRTKLAVSILTGVLVLLTLGCGGDDGPTGPTIKNNKLIIEFYNSPPLPSPWMYQISVFSSGQWIAGEYFNVDMSGDLVDAQGQAIADNTVTFGSLDLLTCDSLRVTFGEQTTAADVGTSMIFLVTAIDSSLSPRMQSPFKDEVGAKDLYFIFGTPSDELDDNELSGIWFSAIDHQTPGLDSLPDLP
ncbi:MAG: hypothetical protein GY869_01835, partial [Planctomycetes bacterium]|nr:hypothetical protein [Planctomycetota bacterium]